MQLINTYGLTVIPDSNIDNNKYLYTKKLLEDLCKLLSKLQLNTEYNYALGSVRIKSNTYLICYSFNGKIGLCICDLYGNPKIKTTINYSIISIVDENMLDIIKDNFIKCATKNFILQPVYNIVRDFCIKTQCIDDKNDCTNKNLQKNKGYIAEMEDLDFTTS